MPPHIPLSPHLRHRPGAMTIFQRQQRFNPGKYHPCKGKNMSTQCDSTNRHQLLTASSIMNAEGKLSKINKAASASMGFSDEG